ncbi:MAG TPA: hypothetical protein VJX71_13695 [Methylomirabilota bacterium]|nr:hypothetical protein [Methylomirabilota bacterium]
MMVGLFDYLEGRGLARRHPNPADRRAHAVHLTDRGRDLLRLAREAADQQEAEPLAPLGGAEREHLVPLLQRLADHAGVQCVQGSPHGSGQCP